MASGSDDLNPIHKELSNITECSICKEVYTDPRSLPCLHTYCLKCIKQCNVNRKPRANADCPLCRNTFKIPADGLGSLPKNFLIDRMIRMKETLIGSAINQNDTSSSSSSSQSRSSAAADGVAEIIDELRRSITVDITNVSSNIERCNSILKQLSTDRSNFVDGVDRIASAVSARVCELKKKIVDDGQELLSNLNTLKDNRLKEVDSLNHNVEHQLTLLSSLKKEMDNLSQKGSAVEMVQKMTGLHDKAGELLKFDVGPSNLDNLGSVDVEFTYCETGDPALNMIGRIDVNRTGRNDIVTRRPSQIYIATTSDSDSSLDSDVDQATSLYTASPRTGIVTQSMGGVQTSAVAKRAASSQASSSQATASKKPKTSVVGSSPSTSTLLRRSASTESSESRTPGPSRTASRQSSMPTPRVFEPVERYGAVDVTILNDQLFVLRNDEYGIAVFDTATFTFQRNIAITGVVVGDILSALTSSATNKCLYVGDKEYKRIHTIELPSRKTTLAWEVHGEPTGLSVNKLSNLIVTCYLPNRILEYTTRGSLVREIDLAFDMNAKHTIQLTNTQFVVCDTRLLTSAHRVWLVDGAGQFKASYGRTNPGTSTLNKPIRLAVDKNGLIFVADRDNDRIVVLNPDLSFVGELPESVVGRLRGPCALHYDAVHDILYVGERSGRVLMIDSISRHCRQ